MSPASSALTEATAVKGTETLAVLEGLAEGAAPSTLGEWKDTHALLAKHLRYTLAYAAASHAAQNKRDAPALAAKSAEERRKGRQPITDEDFAEDNEYIMSRFEAWDKPAFTVQRLAEVLSAPRKYNSATAASATAPALLADGGAQDGELRTDKLQDALRKCVLVV